MFTGIHRHANRLALWPLLNIHSHWKNTTQEKMKAKKNSLESWWNKQTENNSWKWSRPETWDGCSIWQSNEATSQSEEVGVTISLKVWPEQSGCERAAWLKMSLQPLGPARERWWGGSGWAVAASSRYGVAKGTKAQILTSLSSC